MSAEELFFISLAVSLDAFGVSLAIGLNKRVKIKQKIFFAISFGFFQFLFSLIGGVSGKMFTENVAKVPSLVGGIVIAIIGILMINEGMRKKESNLVLTFKMYFVLGISVSIDAIVIGFIALSGIQNMLTLTCLTVVIGIITLIMCILALIIARYLRKIDVIGKYADYVGGIILILFGLKMIFF